MQKSDGVIIKYAMLLSKFTQEEKVSFYEHLAHNLTICCRELWTDEDLTKDEMIESMKWLNEILHRVIAKIRVERLQTHEWTEESMFK